MIVLLNAEVLFQVCGTYCNSHNVPSGATAPSNEHRCYYIIIPVQCAALSSNAVQHTMADKHHVSQPHCQLFKKYGFSLVFSFMAIVFHYLNEF